MLNTHGENAWELLGYIHQFILTNWRTLFVRYFDKQNCNTSEDTFEEFLRLKGDRVIDKFYRGKYSSYQVSKMA